MKYYTQVFAYSLSITISAASYQTTILNSKERAQESGPVSSEIEEPWWHWFTTLVTNPFFLFAILSLILVFSLTYIRKIYISKKEEEAEEILTSKPK